MVVDLPLPPAPVTARIEASSTLPAAPPPYEYRLVGEGETTPERVPVRQLRGADRVNPVRVNVVAGSRPAGLHGKYASANPIQLILDRLGFYLGTLFPEIWSKNVTKKPVTARSGLGEGAPDPVPTGDPIPVGGGGNPGGGGGNPGG